MATVPPAITPQDLLKSVKAEIKSWEKDFQLENGRKPTKEDVYKDTDIFELYKLFNRLKNESKGSTEKPSKSTNGLSTNDPQSQVDNLVKRPQGSAALGSDASPVVLQPIPIRPTASHDDRPSPLPEVTTSPDSEGRPPQRPGTAGSISRAEALKKHQASRKRQTANVGRVVQSAVTGPSVPVLSIEAASGSNTPIPGQVPIPAPSALISTVSPTSPINIEDDGIAHPTTMHIIAPESSVEESTTAPVLSLDSSGNAPQFKRDAFAHGTEPLASKLERPTSASSASSGGVEVDTSDGGDDGRAGGMVASLDQLNDDEKSGVTAAPGAEPVKGEQVLKALGVEPLAIPSSVLKPPAEGEVLRGSVTRVKVPTRPNVTSFYFRNEADNNVIVSARREPSLKMKPTYYLFDHGSPTEAVKESSIWRIKGNFEGSTFRITDGRTGDLLGIVHYTSSCVPRAMLVVASTPTSGPITARQEELLISSHFNWPPASNSELASSRLLVYRNKLPKFNETMKTFCLNFHGRVTMPSVKNFQLALADEVDEPGSKGTGGQVRLQFGRIGRDAFSIDVHDPMMVMMGWAIALTTFDAIEKV